MKNLFTYPLNSGTYYVDPTHIGDGTYGVSQRIDEMLNGTYNFWKTIDPVSDLSATWQNTTDDISKFINYFDHYKEGENLTIHDIYQLPLIVVDKELNTADQTGYNLNIRVWDDYDADPGLTHLAAEFTLPSWNSYYTGYDLVPSGFNNALTFLNDSAFTSLFEAEMSDATTMLLRNRSNLNQLKIYSKRHSTPIHDAVADTTVIFTDAAHGLANGTPFDINVEFDSNLQQIIFERKDGPLYVDITGPNTYNLYYDEAQTVPVKYPPYSGQMFYSLVTDSSGNLEMYYYIPDEESVTDSSIMSFGYDSTGITFLSDGDEIGFNENSAINVMLKNIGGDVYAKTETVETAYLPSLTWEDWTTTTQFNDFHDFIDSNDYGPPGYKSWANEIIEKDGDSIIVGGTTVNYGTWYQYYLDGNQINKPYERFLYKPEGLKKVSLWKETGLTTPWNISDLEDEIGLRTAYTGDDILTTPVDVRDLNVLGFGYYEALPLINHVAADPADLDPSKTLVLDEFVIRKRPIQGEDRVVLQLDDDYTYTSGTTTYYVGENTNTLTATGFYAYDSAGNEYIPKHFENLRVNVDFDQTAGNTLVYGGMKYFYDTENSPSTADWLPVNYFYPDNKLAPWRVGTDPSYPPYRENLYADDDTTVLNSGTRYFALDLPAEFADGDFATVLAANDISYTSLGQDLDGMSVHTDTSAAADQMYEMPISSLWNGSISYGEFPGVKTQNPFLGHYLNGYTYHLSKFTDDSVPDPTSNFGVVGVAEDTLHYLTNTCSFSINGDKTGSINNNTAKEFMVPFIASVDGTWRVLIHYFDSVTTIPAAGANPTYYTPNTDGFMVFELNTDGTIGKNVDVSGLSSSAEIFTYGQTPVWADRSAVTDGASFAVTQNGTYNGYKKYTTTDTGLRTGDIVHFTSGVQTIQLVALQMSTGDWIFPRWYTTSAFTDLQAGTDLGSSNTLYHRRETVGRTFTNDLYLGSFDTLTVDEERVNRYAVGTSDGVQIAHGADYQFKDNWEILLNVADSYVQTMSLGITPDVNTVGRFLEPTNDAVPGYVYQVDVPNNDDPTTGTFTPDTTADNPRFRAASATLKLPGNQIYVAISETGNVTPGSETPNSWFPAGGAIQYPTTNELNCTIAPTLNSDELLTAITLGARGRYDSSGDIAIALRPGANDFPYDIYPFYTQTNTGVIGDPGTLVEDRLENEFLGGQLTGTSNNQAWFSTFDIVTGDHPVRVWPTHVKPMTVEVSTRANNFGSVSATNNISTIVPVNKTIMVTVEYPPLTKEQFKPFQAIWSMAGSGTVFRLPLADEIFGDPSQNPDASALRVVGTQTVGDTEYWKVQGLPASTTNAIKKGQVFYTGNNHTGGTVTVANNCDSNVYGEALVVFAEQEYDMPSKDNTTLLYAQVPWVNASISQSPGFEYTINTDETVNLAVTFALDKYDTTAYQNQDID